MQRLRYGVTAVAFLLLLAVGAFAAVAVTEGPAQALGTSKPPTHKVTLCHATHSSTNPYVSIDVDVASAGVAADLHGHRSHADDIIPTFTYDGVTYQGQGDQSILANGCKVTQTTTTTPTTTETTPSTTTTLSTSTTSTSTTTTTTTSTSTAPSTSTPSSTSSSTTTPSTSTPKKDPTPTTTVGDVAATTTVASAPKRLQVALRKQARKHGTGRTSGPNVPGELPNTGFPVWAYALIGAGLLMSGLLALGLARAAASDELRHYEDRL
jgi:LPXTG-motif cell wall-anchored protein